MELRNDLLDAWDRAHFIHPLSALGGHERGETANRILSNGQGVYVVDRSGRRTLDAFAGLFCVNVGYGRTEIAERTPDGLDHVYFGLTGSDANETAVKFVWYYNNILGRPKKKE